MKILHDLDGIVTVADYFKVVNKDTGEDEGDIHFIVKDKKGTIHFAHSEHSYINEEDRFFIDNGVIAIDEDENELDAGSASIIIGGEFKE